MLPPFVPHGEVFCDSPQADGVSDFGNGGGGVFRWLQRVEALNNYKVRAWRWLNAKQALRKSLADDKEKGESHMLQAKYLHT